MKIAHPALSASLRWDDVPAVTLVAESPEQFRTMAIDLLQMAEGMKGDFILSKDDVPVEFCKVAEVISDPFRVDPSTNRRLMTALLKDAANVATHELTEQLTKLYQNLANVMDTVIDVMRQELTYTEVCDALTVIKLCSLRPDMDGLSLPERILLYMELCNQYLDKELFILFHTKACFTDSERKCLCRDVGYRDWKLLFLESGRGAVTDTDREYVRILDEDLCEL